MENNAHGLESTPEPVSHVPNQLESSKSNNDPKLEGYFFKPVGLLMYFV